MDNTKVVEFLKNKKAGIERLKAFSADSREFKTWYESFKALSQRLGGDYQTRFNSLSFWSMIITDNNYDTDAYLEGLVDAEALIESMIEEFEMWGSPKSAAPSKSKKEQSDGAVNLNFTISQQQAQHLRSEVKLDQFEPEVQEKVTELLNELQKKNKNKERIKNIFKWLADKSTDALIALLAA